MTKQYLLCTGAFGLLHPLQMQAKVQVIGSVPPHFWTVLNTRLHPGTAHFTPSQARIIVQANTPDT